MIHIPLFVVLFVSFAISQAMAASDIAFLENILNGTNKSSKSPIPVKNISEFLARLHEANQMPVGFLSIYKSNSANSYEVSRENPRILLKWKDSILAFNGKNNELEVATFNDKTKKFELYHYRLSAPRQNGRHHSGKNPKSCLKCHANSAGDPYPIYDGYNTWPGYYGTNDGQIQGKEWLDYRRFKETHNINDSANQDKAKHNTKSVYSYLIDWDQKTEFAYEDPNGHRVLDHYMPTNCNPKVINGTPPPDQKTRGKNKEDLRYRFVDFGKFLYSKHQEYVAYHKILGTSLEPYRYAILGAALCPSNEFDERSFLPDSLKSKFQSFDFDKLIEDTKRVTAASYAHKVEGVRRDLNQDSDKNGRTGPVYDRGGKVVEGVTEYEQDLRRLEGFKASDGGRTGPYSVGYKGSAENYGIYARVRFIVEKIAGHKMDWSTSRKATQDEYFEEAKQLEKHKLENSKLRHTPPLSKMSHWSKHPEMQISGPEDYHFGQGCFDFERPENWKALLTSGKGSNDDKNADSTLLSLLDQAMTNYRPHKAIDQFGYILSPERIVFCKALQGRSKMVLKRFDQNGLLPPSSNSNAFCNSKSLDFGQIKGLSNEIDDALNPKISDKEHIQKIMPRDKEIFLKLEQKGYLYRSVSIPDIGKLQFYKDEAAIAVTHLKNNDAPVLSFQSNQCCWSNCTQLIFSNGDSVTLSQADADKFGKLFQLYLR